jgi:hypothetical protein
MTNATYLGEVVIDDIKCDHFSSDFVMFGVDYFQSKELRNGFPSAVRLSVGADMFIFKNITNGIPDDSVFELPPNTKKCKY